MRHNGANGSSLLLGGHLEPVEDAQKSQRGKNDNSYEEEKQEQPLLKQVIRYASLFAALKPFSAKNILTTTSSNCRRNNRALFSDYTLQSLFSEFESAWDPMALSDKAAAA